MLRRRGVFIAVVGTLAGSFVAALPAAAAATPTVSRLSAASGPIAGGGRIGLTGTHFASGAVVRFGSTAGRSVSVKSTTSLWVTVPAHATGTVSVQVTVAGHTSPASAAATYRYFGRPVLSGVSPGASAPAGGGTVVVRGSDFTTGSIVQFAENRASVHYVSASQLNVVVPPHAAGVVDILVTSGYGSSAIGPASRFSYRSPPAPVTGLAVADLSATSVTLRWQRPAADVANVVVRRAEGSVPPPTPGSGQAVATVGATTTAVVDTAVAAQRSYSYSVFTATAVGPLYSSPASVAVRTPNNSRPDVPSRLSTSPEFEGTCTGDAPARLGDFGGAPLDLSAYVSDPDGAAETLSTTFRFWDASGEEPVYLPLANGGTVARAGSGNVSVRYGGELTDGTLYAFDATSDDGTEQSTGSTVCYVRYDTHVGGAVVTSPDTEFHAGVPAHFHIVTTGPAANLDHFRYSFSSSSEAATAGQRLDATDGAADLTFTPTAWGTNYLFVSAVGHDGARSGVAAFSFYVRSA